MYSKALSLASPLPPPPLTGPLQTGTREGLITRSLVCTHTSFQQKGNVLPFTLRRPPVARHHTFFLHLYSSRAAPFTTDCLGPCLRVSQPACKHQRGRHTTGQPCRSLTLYYPSSPWLRCHCIINSAFLHPYHLALCVLQFHSPRRRLLFALRFLRLGRSCTILRSTAYVTRPIDQYRWN
jgi:hypothetical protein